MADKNNKKHKLKRTWNRLSSLWRTLASPAEPVIGTVCISMVRNEQDIIEPFLRHNRRFFDLMFILDNGSTDRTREIILAVANELGGIVVTDLPERSYDQSRFMSQALRYVQGAVFADAVCFLDADEFVSAPDRETFDRIWKRLPVGQLGLMPWRTYLPDPTVEESALPDPLARMTFCRVEERPVHYKVLLRMGGRVDPGLALDQGNHLARDRNGNPLPTVTLADLPVLHLPVRSSAQLTTKGVVGWIANQARASLANLPEGGQPEAYQWKRISDLVDEGKAAFSAVDLAEEALNYAQTDDPLPWEKAVRREAHGIGTLRKYSDGSYGNPSALIAAAKAHDPMPGQRFVLPQPPSREDLEPGIENAFTGAWHWDFLFLDAAPIHYMMERHRPAAVLDIGCGNGAYPLLYRAYGATEVLGLDGIEADTTVLGEDEYRKVDLQEPLDLGRRYDLVVCLEVVEHVRPADTATLFDTIERHAQDLILFSMAEPGQPGNGHINCVSIAEVLDLWAARGWEPDLTETLAVRALSTMSWFRRNLLVLRRSGKSKASTDAQRLRQIGSMAYHWYGQEPGLRMAAFSEPFPEPPFAYGLRL